MKSPNFRPNSFDWGRPWLYISDFQLETSSITKHQNLPDMTKMSTIEEKPSFSLSFWQEVRKGSLRFKPRLRVNQKLKATQMFCHYNGDTYINETKGYMVKSLDFFTVRSKVNYFYPCQLGLGLTYLTRILDALWDICLMKNSSKYEYNINEMCRY